jgi:hypothetical protein
VQFIEVKINSSAKCKSKFKHSTETRKSLIIYSGGNQMFNSFFRNTPKKLWTAGCALALVFFIALPAVAQQKDSQTGKQQMQMQQRSQQQTPDFSNDQIEKTAQSYTKITEIREQYQDQFSQAESTEQAQELQTKINEKITGAIEKNDMSVEEYNEVITAAQTDEDLLAELLDRIREMRK